MLHKELKKFNQRKTFDIGYGVVGVLSSSAKFVKSLIWKKEEEEKKKKEEVKTILKDLDKENSHWCNFVDIFSATPHMTDDTYTLSRIMNLTSLAKREYLDSDQFQEEILEKKKNNHSKYVDEVIGDFLQTWVSPMGTGVCFVVLAYTAISHGETDPNT